MDSDRQRLSPWLTVLAVLCASVGIGSILLDDGDERAPGPIRSTARVVEPPSSPASRAAVAIPAKPPETERESTASSYPAASGEPSAQPPGRPFIVVRNGAEVTIRDAPAGDVVAREDDETEFGSTTVFSVDEVRNRWIGVPTAKLPNGKLGWVRADPQAVSSGYTEFRIEVDLSRHEARLWKGERLLRKWTVTVGGPETPTPTGRFSVTDLFEGGLNPAYGCCAVALSATQPDLPSGWAGGDRIAFHGTDGPLGVDGSNGCIRSPDRDVRALVHTVPLGTPVTIRR
ncbi:MAG TPA: L,D-transpeptidase family protein [Solirubrobacterales bacterium]|jgi:lipoprotein-anchoring transpeptidase ErfK/SrfK|nr:L,D-transpeptidase family protein [Solirubrobacterales bacterium]